MPLPAQPNQSLIHGMACLQTVTSAGEPLGSREVARRMNIEPTRANRLLGTLCHLGLLERTASRKYRPGPGIHVLSALSLRGSGLLGSALPHLQRLTGNDLIVSLGVLWEQHVCYLVRAEPGVRPENALGAHEPVPAFKSILGLALMAGMKDNEVRARLLEPPPAIGPKELSAFIGELADTRRSGYAMRHTDGKYAVAVTIGSGLAAIGLTGIPKKRSIPSHVRRLQQAAEAMTWDMR